MKRCVSCKAEYPYVSGIELFTYVHDAEAHSADDVRQTRETNFCSHVCARQRLDKKRWDDPHSSYAIVYNKLVEMCSNCGNLTHPTEFCSTFDTPQTLADQFQTLSDNGHLPRYNGKIVCLLLSPDMQVDFEVMDTSCPMYTLKSRDAILNDLGTDVEHPEILSHNLLEERAPIIYLHRDPTQLKEFVEYTIIGRSMEMGEVFSISKQLLTKYKVRTRCTPSTSQDSVELIFQTIHSMDNGNKLYLPFSIMRDTCTVPVSHFGYTPKRCTITNGDHLTWDTFQKGTTIMGHTSKTYQFLIRNIEEERVVHIPTPEEIYRDFK